MHEYVIKCMYKFRPTLSQLQTLIFSNYWMRLSRIWRILQIKEGVIHRGRRPRWVTPSEICRILHILRKPNSIIALLFIQNIPHFWLVKTASIIHHNQLLFTKFGKNLRHIESMTSKVEPSKNYWTIDVKIMSKVQPAADYWTVDRENLGTRLRYIWWAEKQRAKWRHSFKNE